MLTLFRQRNFARLWFGGLISLMGDRVLMIALPFFVYQETGSTIASAVMVAAELLPRLLFGSIAGVYVDRWNRRNVMVMTSIAQGLVILPLFLVESGISMWIVYLISFLQTTLAMFFGPAENALLPLLVREEELLPANSLNAMNNNLARLIGPPIGGALLAMWGLPGVVLFDSITFVAAGLLILTIRHSETKVESQVSDSEAAGRSRFWKEWLEGIDVVRKNRVVFILFLSVVLLNFGGIMIDPLSVPYILDVVGAGVNVFGWMMTVQAVGGILGGLLAARVNRRISTVSMYGWSEVILGLILIARYNIPDLPVLFVTTLITGFPAALGMAALETLFQQKVPNSHLGRISGALNTTVGLTSLFGVLGISGILGELLGVVPVLNIAAGITLMTGWIVLIFLPRE
ncbi:MAG TPA: MFS transporter [Anaerolineales bacterium]|nr:MFS transporter [Anaerolineales bacterium]